MDSSSKGSSPVETPTAKKSAPEGIGMVRFTEWAENRVIAKRKRKGLGELKPRKKNAMRQIVANSVTLGVANVLVAPLERCRIMLQTAPMSIYQRELPTSTRALFPYIIKTQGMEALWRGATPHIYKQWTQIVLKVAFYDRIKHTMMPYGRNKYGTLDFFIRS